MDFNEILKVVECVLGQDEHLLNNALGLSCGHFVCKKCFPPNNNYQFNCPKCNETNQTNLSLCKESGVVKFYMQKHLGSIFKILNEKIKIEIDILKKPIESLQNFYNLKIEHIRDEIDVRTESLIADLQSLREQYFKKLDDVKSKIEEGLRKLNEKIQVQDNTDFINKINFNTECGTLNELYDTEKHLLDIRRKNEFYHNKPFELNLNVSEFKLEIDHIGKLIFFENGEFESTILTDENLKNKLQTFVGSFKKWELLYRASIDGFQASKFHEKCDNKANTVTIIKSSNGFVFGGFTTQAWDSSGTYKKDNNAFIFSLINQDNNPQKFLIKQNCIYQAIRCVSGYGPTFGGGYDFIVCDSPNSYNSSYSRFGHTFDYSGGNNQDFLAGSFYFNVSEVEVFATN